MIVIGWVGMLAWNGVAAHGLGKDGGAFAEIDHRYRKGKIAPGKAFGVARGEKVH